MITKDEFVRRISKGQPLSRQELDDLETGFEQAQEAAAVAVASMPSIGLFSVAKRLEAFLAVCRALDDLVESGKLTGSSAQISLLILRVSNPAFLKAVTMFDIRGTRYDARALANMPRSAREYLAGIKTYG